MATDASQIGPRRYRPRPLEVTAIQFNGQNADQVIAFTGAQAVGDNQVGIEIVTLEGTMHASVGDYIVCGTAGEFYPVKPAIFGAKYEDLGAV